MTPIEIHDRGRGPELKGTRLTVYDVMPFKLSGHTPEHVADALTGVTAEGVAALYRYIDEHYDAVLAVHNTIEERIARGNPPWVEGVAARARERIRRYRDERGRRGEEGRNGAPHPG